MTMEKSYATFYFLAIPKFALSVTVCDILTVTIYMTLTLTFGMGKGQMLICQSKGYMRHYALAIAMFSLSVTVCEMYMTLTLKLEFSKVKCKFTDRKATCHFLCVGNSYVWSNCHRLRDNHVWTSQCTRFDSLTLKMKVKDVGDLDENG